VDPGFVGPEVYTIFGALVKKNNTKLRMEENIYLGPQSLKLKLHWLHGKCAPPKG
jgi:hypothetical protein